MLHLTSDKGADSKPGKLAAWSRPGAGQEQAGHRTCSGLLLKQDFPPSPALPGLPLQLILTSAASSVI